MAGEQENTNPGANETPTPTPTETPDETPAGGTETPEGTEDDTFQAFLQDDADDLDLDEVPASEEGEGSPSAAEAGEEGAAPPKEEKPEEGKTPPEEKPAAKPEAEAGAEPTGEPQKPPAEEPETPPTPEQQLEQYNEWRKNTEATLASEHYALTKEQAEMLDDEPGKLIPDLMSKVFVDAVSASVTHVMRVLPQLMDGLTESRAVAQQDETKFFDQWPQLREHKETVVKFGQLYRQSYPNASAEEFIRDVGAQALVALKLSPDGNGGGTPPSNEPPSSEAQPSFRPAGGSPPRGAPAPSDKNPFEAVDEELFRDDLDLG